MSLTPVSERDARLVRIRAAMERAGLDALVVGGKGHMWTGRGYLRYLADFHLWGHDALIVLPLDAAPAISVTSPAIAKMISQRGWVEEAYGDMLLVPRAVSLLREKRLDRARIGMVGGRWVIPYEVVRALADALPEASFVPADPVLDAVRVAKSPVEVEQNRELWALAQRAIARFEEVLRPGASQQELCAEGAKVALAGGARDLMMLFADRADEYGPPTAAPVRCDDIVRFHMEICGPSGHWCELTTTLVSRERTDAEWRLMAAELAGYEAVRAAARPGARLADLATVFETTLVEDGWRLEAPTTKFDFHGQGQDVIELPWYAAEPPWGASEDAELVEGMVLSYHPSRNVTGGPDWSPGISDSLLVTADGGEWLSQDWQHDWKEMPR